MHKLRSKTSIRRFRIVALLVCAKCVLVPAFGVLLLYSMFTSNRDHMILAFILLALAFLTLVLRWILAQKTNCPLCITAVLASRSCAKSKRARKLFGSYRLYLALSILLRNSFRCPYCNEPTVLRVREKRDHSPYSRG